MLPMDQVNAWRGAPNSAERPPQGLARQILSVTIY
jgi:hypothetical protein